MFRLGTLLFIPGYVTVTLYRLLATPESGGSLIVMIRKYHRSFAEWLFFAHGAPSFTSLDDQHVSVTRFLDYRDFKICLPFRRVVRYCGATFTFTSVSILLNYSTRSKSMSLPSLVTEKELLEIQCLLRQ
jgi:hypothetical protein